ncbi:MAG: hypothetical protein WC491_07700 [Candidatus Omnitrophota bacterium]
MRKVLPALLLLAVVFLISGCFINMTAVTKINDDGSGFRITTYTADGASEKEELIKEYLLPGDGSWKLDNYVKDSPPQHIYEVKRTFKDIKELQPDYARRGASPSNISDNRYSLKIRRGVIFNSYEYEEIYRDCADEGRIREFCKRWYDATLAIISEEVAAAFPRSVKKDGVTLFLDAKFRPLYDYFLGELMANGRKSLEDDNNTANKAKRAEFEALYDADNFASYMADYIASADKGLDRKRAYDKLLALHKKIEEKLSDQSESLSERNYDDAFGVYGWPIFMGYSFNVSVTLPGRIVDANTGDIRSNTANWKFDNNDFQMNEYRLSAVSRKFNPAGTAIISVVLLLIIYSAYRGKTKKK